MIWWNDRAGGMTVLGPGLGLIGQERVDVLQLDWTLTPGRAGLPHRAAGR